MRPKIQLKTRWMLPALLIALAVLGACQSTQEA